MNRVQCQNVFLCTAGRPVTPLQKKNPSKVEVGHGGVDGELDCREPNEVQEAPSAALRLHLSCS